MKDKMGRFSLFSVVCSLSSVFGGSFSAAAELEITRYDLGQRLVQLERSWEAHPEAVARARALPVVKMAVPQLFAGNMAEAAATLDRARMLLESPEPMAAERWAASLLVHPRKRLIDPAETSLPIRIDSAYAAGDPPAGLALRLSFVSANGKPKSAPLEIRVSKLPIDAAIPIGKLPEGDYTLRVEVVATAKVLATYATGISAVPNLARRLHDLPLSRLPFADSALGESLDAKTLRSLAGLLGSLAGGVTPETTYPADRLLAEADALLGAILSAREFYGPERTGQFWLTVPTGGAGTPVRLFVPDAAKAGKPLPLVVALHGAGGSENLFFDAYGNGLIARLAQERGWMVVAPRAGWLFDAPPPAPAIINELAKIYPVDKGKIYIVGHSMGAMQAVALTQQAPGRFAAIAALAGGGSVTKPEAFKDLPVFIGCGREDFLLRGAKALAEALERAGATRVTYKEYPGVEHMLVVQESLPEVFKFFAAAGDGPPKHR